MVIVEGIQAPSPELVRIGRADSGGGLALPHAPCGRKANPAGVLVWSWQESSGVVVVMRSRSGGGWGRAAGNHPPPPHSVAWLGRAGPPTPAGSRRPSPHLHAVHESLSLRPRASGPGHWR